MGDFFVKLFSTDAYPARWHCGQWTAGEGWLHIGADVAVWGAYTTIPLILAYFVLQRKDIPLPRIFWLFAAFIFACGFTHLLDAFMFWWPAYRFSGIAKLTTAIVSWMAVGALIQVTPIALRLPGLAVVNRQLEQANNDLNAFAHIVSHDLRAPLRSMRQLSQWIREDVEKGGSPELEEHLRQLDEKAARMDSLIAGILRYSSATRELDEEELKLHDAHELVVEALSLVDVPPGIEVSIADKLPRIPCYAIQMQQVFQNLIHNAVKYMGNEVGEIRIGCQDDGAQWIFEVRDTGIGIPAAQQKRIFEMFHTLHPTPGGAVGGIGLAVVKRIIEKHGGRISVASEVGAGSAFRFTVPKRSAPKRGAMG